MDKIRRNVALSFILAGVIGATLSVKSLADHTKRLSGVEANLSSREQFITERVIKTEGTLDDYNRFLELKERYAKFEREYSVHQNALQDTVYKHKQSLESAGVGTLLSGSAIVTGIYSLLYELVRRKR